MSSQSLCLFYYNRGMFNMRKFSWKFAVTFTTFCIGVLIASVLLFPKQSKTENSKPNSFHQSQVETTVAQVPTVEPKRERFTVAGVKSDEEVERFWTAFQKAVADDDRNKVASMANYPLKLNYYFDPLKKNGSGSNIRESLFSIVAMQE